VATLTRLLGDSSLSVVLALGSDEHGLVFEDGARRITALWSEGTVLWRLIAAEEKARILARNGSDLTPAGLERGLQIRVHSADGPIYLVGNVEVLPSSRCAGDCLGDGAVGVEELVTAVGIALGSVEPVRCAAVDTNDDGRASVDEIVVAVSRALRGCPLPD
jgi:hypothetical protein